MIYAGYENGSYFVRFTHDVKVVSVASIFQEGYRIFWGHMVLIKNREQGISARNGAYFG